MQSLAAHNKQVAQQLCISEFTPKRYVQKTSSTSSSCPLGGRPLRSTGRTLEPEPAGRGDIAGLLRSLKPDAVVVDGKREVDEPAVFARESDSPLVRIALRERKLELLRNGRWEEAPENEASPEVIRYILVGGSSGRGGT